MIETVIGPALTHDADIGDSARVTYLIDRQSSKGRFRVDPDTEAMIVTGRLVHGEQETRGCRLDLRVYGLN